MANTYKGVRVPFTIRMPADLHRGAVMRARRDRISLNEMIVRAIAASTQMESTAVGERTNLTTYSDTGENLGRT